MAAKKKTTKTKKAVVSPQSSRIVFAASIIFAGVCIILIGNWQGNERLKLFLVGFGSALLVVGGVLSFLATQKK
jgi:uncharacterized membrane protein YiaA